MKKTLKLMPLVVAAFAAMALASCGDDDPTGGRKGSVVGQAVDLGLSVKWASHNVGALEAGAVGGLYGWSDYTGSRHSQDNIEVRFTTDSTLVQWNSVYYGGINPPKNICASDSDIARLQWGGKWRLPSRQEVQELIDNCQWQETVVGGQACVKVTGRNGNSIVLPMAGYSPYAGSKEQTGSAIYYWSGTCASRAEQKEWKIDGNTQCAAWSLVMHSGDTKPQLEASVRCFGLSVRPVTE